MLQALLHVGSLSLTLYAGPSTPALCNVAASIELPESGLVLEVADSLVANGGRGLFIRVTDGATVTLDRGSPLCGYAEGEMEKVPDEAGGKTVAFHLRSPDASVFFEGHLRSVRELLDTPDVDSIVGHVAVRDSESGELTGLQLLDDQQQFFVPRAEQPSPPSIMTLGQMATISRWVGRARASTWRGRPKRTPSFSSSGWSATRTSPRNCGRLGQSPPWRGP